MGSIKGKVFGGLVVCIGRISCYFLGGLLTINNSF